MSQSGTTFGISAGKLTDIGCGMGNAATGQVFDDALKSGEESARISDGLKKAGLTLQSIAYETPGALAPVVIAKTSDPKAFAKDAIASSTYETILGSRAVSRLVPRGQRHGRQTGGNQRRREPHGIRADVDKPRSCTPVGDWSRLPLTRSCSSRGLAETGGPWSTDRLFAERRMIARRRAGLRAEPPRHGAHRHRGRPTAPPESSCSTSAAIDRRVDGRAARSFGARR